MFRRNDPSHFRLDKNAPFFLCAGGSVPFRPAPDTAGRQIRTLAAEWPASCQDRGPRVATSFRGLGDRHAAVGNETSPRLRAKSTIRGTDLAQATPRRMSGKAPAARKQTFTRAAAGLALRRAIRARFRQTPRHSDSRRESGLYGPQDAAARAAVVSSVILNTEST